MSLRRDTIRAPYCRMPAGPLEDSGRPGFRLQERYTSSGDDSVRQMLPVSRPTVHASGAFDSSNESPAAH